ncbi:MAG: hypothetical protein O7C59_03220 [Rickettsia endosymbiont of Ixodes persulcatus]|nr:hypothetical protein [Rickettsia endosymbiont of Ixodes persulcatus]MCZ6909936.1 hypothetical protein [Rickettsia endosymbiont of Ixodes persulcatus]MCZ6913585.1 hypothetical protein [Rickettsia endosymbiont of Ixodes persulcatus]MCZ6919638.1 hypothetical protein [Rickettsia endosymbiont of Ixodes persulcatus]MCZ6924402.1 hypothetical protein [Rickettsia endosymbiont of Ixodes persulcatus]
MILLDMLMDILSKKENKFIDHQDNIYKYNPDKDIYNYFRFYI